MSPSTNRIEGLSNEVLSKNIAGKRLFQFEKKDTKQVLLRATVARASHEYLETFPSPKNIIYFYSMTQLSMGH